MRDLQIEGLTLASDALMVWGSLSNICNSNKNHNEGDIARLENYIADIKDYESRKGVINEDRFCSHLEGRVLLSLVAREYYKASDSENPLTYVLNDLCQVVTNLGNLSPDIIVPAQRLRDVFWKVHENAEHAGMNSQFVAPCLALIRKGYRHIA